MALINQYVDQNATPATDFEPLPSGEYPAIITDSDMKATKSNDGQYLELTYQVIDGPFKGRLVWARLNLDNKNPKTVEIANQHLAALRVACGFAVTPPDSTQLHNIPHLIRVEFQAADGNRRTRDGNEIRGWKPLDGATQGAGAAAPSPFVQPAGARAAVPSAAPAWATKPATA